MIPHLYRFRPVGALLDRHEELAKQEIYFSPPEELNDPMEGYKDVFWSGDRVVWRNLLRHYLLCLLQTTSLCVVMGEKFDPKYFAGNFRLFDDGRRSGKLTLKVDDEGGVTGSYYSDKDGQKYDVQGKIGTPHHSIEFRVKFPRSEQVFKGMLFTGDGKAIAGTSRLVEREAGFYAVRGEE